MGFKLLNQQTNSTLGQYPGKKKVIYCSNQIEKPQGCLFVVLASN
jgi:hypothetical protein